MAAFTALRFHGKGITQLLMPIAWLMMGVFFASFWLNLPQWVSVVAFTLAMGLLVADFLIRPSRRAKQEERN